jgi:predicted Rossmann-fold nucleotide-binding protein
MDEYTANPLQTERDAQRVLRKMHAEKTVGAADKARAAEKAAEARELARRFSIEGKSVFSGGGGGAGVLPKTGQKKAEYKKGGMVRSSASKRADGIAQRGKTRGKIV